MRILQLLGVSVLTLWSCIELFSVNASTEISGVAEVDFLWDAITDGFIVDNPVFPSATAESEKHRSTSSTEEVVELPSTNIPTTDPGKEGASDVPNEADSIEDDTSEEGSTGRSSLQDEVQDELFSANTDPYSTTRPSNLPNQSTSIPIPTKNPISTTIDNHNSSATVIKTEDDLFFEEKTQSTTGTNGEGRLIPDPHRVSSTPESYSPTTATRPYEKETLPSSYTPILGLHSGMSHTSTSAGITTKNQTFLSEIDDLGSGSGLESTTITVIEETFERSDPVNVVNRISMATNEKELHVTSTENAIKQVREVDPALQQHHGTQGWLVIVAVTVGIIAMLLVCVAIATRESWNGLNQESGDKKEKVSLKGQQGAEERETMLYEKPKENLHVGAYSVILLEELPEEKPLH